MQLQDCPSSEHLAQTASRISGVSVSSWLMLRGDFALFQAPMLDSLAFDPFALFDG